MRIGDTFVLNLDKTMPNLTTDYTSNTEFPTQMIFDFEEWRFYKNYMKIVRQEENVDLVGNKNAYSMNSNF